MLKHTFAIALLLTAAPHAIGLQHGVFRSQSTQGPAWTGSAEIFEETFRITVHPDYLDVELDWVFKVGGNPPEKYADALEIVGNINLVANSSVEGMLVWYKDMILKAKLKKAEAARSQYEQVVDRNSPVPPRPRDPVLLEWIRQDNYDISIFPVAWGATRKVRLRYLVPMQAGWAVYPYAFSPNANAVIRPAPELQRFGILFEDNKQEAYPAETTFSGKDYSLQSYGSGRTPSAIQADPQDSITASRFLSGSFTGTRFGGQVIHAFLVPPAPIRNMIAATGFPGGSLSALIRSGGDSCRIEYPIGRHYADLRLYSQQPVDAKIYWRLQPTGQSVIEISDNPSIHAAEDGLQYARSFGMGPFYPLAGTMPASLGVALGFIDEKYALVALEGDALEYKFAAMFANHGVPTLAPSEIFPAPDENFAVPLESWLQARNQTKRGLAAVYYPNFGPIQVSLQPGSRLPNGVRLVRAGNRLEIMLPAALLREPRSLQVEIRDLRGTLVKSWTGEECRSGHLSWSPAESGRAAGIYLLSIRVAGVAYSARFSMP